MRHLKKVFETMEEVIEKYTPYAEEGITHDELELLSKSKIRFINVHEWNLELLVRFHYILVFLIMRKILKNKSFAPNAKWFDRDADEKNENKIVWNISESDHKVYVDLHEGNIMLKNFEFDYTEVYNPIKFVYQSRFDL